MSFTAYAPAARPGSHPAEAGPKRVRSFRLIGSALLWMVAALFGAMLGAVIGGFVVGLIAALMQAHLPPVWYRLNGGPFTVVSGFSLQGILLLAAWRHADRIGNENRRTGLGWLPIQHRGAVIALAATLLCSDCALIVLLGHSPLFRSLAVKAGASLFGPVYLSRAWQLIVLASRVALAVAIAPVCEELFFRGWLWTGLRRVWSIWPVMLVTASLWLAMHLADGIYRPLFLLPAAIILTSIRAIAGSVRAAIAAHMFNNGLAVALMISVSSFR